MSELIQLIAGPIVTLDAIRVFLDMESRGHKLTARNGALHVTNGSGLTDEDRVTIKRHKQHLLALACYEGPTL